MTDTRSDSDNTRIAKLERVAEAAKAVAAQSWMLRDGWELPCAETLDDLDEALAALDEAK